MLQSDVSVDFLDQVFAELGSRQDVLSRAAGAFDAAARGAKNVVIFGCGHLGKIAVSGVIKAGLPLVALADNNRALWGQSIAGVPVMSPADAVARYNGDAFFLVAIYNSTSPREQLRTLGCERIVPFPAFFWKFSESLSVLGLSFPERILDEADEIKRAYHLLSDEQSRREFATQIQWRCSLDYSCLPRPSGGADTYFDPGLIRLVRDEVFADCGAFDGDSIRMFLDQARHKFRHIYALEPDSKNRSALSVFISSLPNSEAERVSVLPFAVGAYDGVTTFTTTGTAGSSTKASDAAETVECRRLDGLFGDLAPTFIKMDIEGAEPLALRGATELIRRARPILAVCAYHECEHLWTLPALIKEILPDYQVSLRRYAEECWETVYYAIPPERAI